MKRNYRYSKLIAAILALSIVSVLSLATKEEQKVEATTSQTEERDVQAEEQGTGTAEASKSVSSDLEIPISPKNLSQTIKKRTAYTVSYNHDTKQPNWVAWVLTKNHATGKVERMDFEDDEDMPSPKGYKSDYFNTGFDKGHMCPAGDNKWSETAMAESFLMTNMCPQIHSLNAGIWNSIEQQCRSWAKKYGKVYIVCGPIFLNKQHRKLGRNKVVVPDAFFKVVLCMQGNPKAIGFICRNASSKGKKKTDFVNTVDEVERITGYDFFAKLPKNIEKKIESQCDINEW